MYLPGNVGMNVRDSSGIPFYRLARVSRAPFFYLHSVDAIKCVV